MKEVKYLIQLDNLQLSKTPNQGNQKFDQKSFKSGMVHFP